MEIRIFDMEQVGLEEFADLHGLILDLSPTNHHGDPGWAATFTPRVEVREGAMLRTARGLGTTQAGAVRGLARFLSGGPLVLQATSPTHRKECYPASFRVEPSLLARLDKGVPA